MIFLAEEMAQTKISKSNTRLELARIRNKKERDYQKMMKTKARAQKVTEICNLLGKQCQTNSFI